MPYVIYVYDAQLDYYDWFRSNVNVAAREWQLMQPSDCVLMLHFDWNCN